MDSRPTFTVFTPTYNRGQCLHGVYDSLVTQTCRDFEWLVVDDGSTDGSGEIVQRWAAEGKVDIRYKFQENGGKHRAFNTGVRAARGALFLTLDSDDRCIPEALARLKRHWEGIPAADRERFSGVTGLCIRPDGAIIGSRFPADVIDSNSVEIRTRYGVKGEKWGFQRTDILASHLYPEIEGEKYIAPSYIWNRIGRKYLTRYINEPLRIYELSEDSLTVGHLKLRIRNPRGAALYYNELSEMAPSLAARIRSGINYVRFARHAGQSTRKIARQSEDRSILPVGLVIGSCLYLKDLFSGNHMKETR